MAASRANASGARCGVGSGSTPGERRFVGHLGIGRMTVLSFHGGLINRSSAKFSGTILSLLFFTFLYFFYCRYLGPGQGLFLLTV
jgi:hypothetical protein